MSLGLVVSGFLVYAPEHHKDEFVLPFFVTPAVIEPYKWVLILCSVELVLPSFDNTSTISILTLLVNMSIVPSDRTAESLGLENVPASQSQEHIDSSFHRKYMPVVVSSEARLLQVLYNSTHLLSPSKHDDGSEIDSVGICDKRFVRLCEK